MHHNVEVPGCEVSSRLLCLTTKKIKEYGRKGRGWSESLISEKRKLPTAEREPEWVAIFTTEFKLFCETHLCSYLCNLSVKLSVQLPLSV